MKKVVEIGPEERVLVREMRIFCCGSLVEKIRGLVEDENGRPFVRDGRLDVAISFG
jgi:hypothetical protein